MSIAEMQACLARLYVDEPFRKLFYLEPSTLDEYWLSDDEAAALRAIDRALLESYAGSLRNKRRGRIERAYPLLFKMDRDALVRLYARYYQLYTSKSNQSPYQDAIDFGVFVEESVAGVSHLPPFAADIARYERSYYRMRFAPGDGAGVPPSDGAAIPNRVTGGEDIPFLRTGVEIAEFEYDVAEIEERLYGSGGAPEESARSPSSIAFRPSTRTSAARMLRLNGATKAVLDRCDARHTIAQIIAGVEAQLGGRDLGPDIVAVVDRLLALEVLTLDPRLAAADRDDNRAYGSAETESL